MKRRAVWLSALVTLIAVAIPSAAQAENPRYHVWIRSAIGGCLAVQEAAAGSQAFLGGYGFGACPIAGAWKTWTIWPVENGYYHIQNDQTGHCLVAPYWAGNNIVQYPCGPWADQHWYVEFNPDPYGGWLHFRNRHTNTCLVTPYWANYKAVQTACNWGFADQLWSF